MNFLVIYSFKLIICSLIFLGYYFVALRNKQFHHWNRFYLMASIVLSIIIPLFQINLQWKGENEASTSIHLLQVVASTNQHLDEIVITNAKSSFVTMLPVMSYAILSVFMLVFFLTGLKKVYSLSNKYQCIKLDDIEFFNTDARGTPFSFFRKIFWNENIDLHSDSGQQIFQHELVHVQEKHSADKVFIQLVLVVFWFNPVFWLIKKELHLIHEFIADKKSLGDSGASALASMLLCGAYPRHYSSLVNPFFKTSIKRRLAMISTIKNPKVSYLSRLAVLPVIAITILSFGLRHERNNYSPITGEPLVVVIDAGHGKLPSGNFSGAREQNMSEDQIVLQLANAIQKMNSNPQIKILLSRPSEQLVELRERVDFAEKNRADIFISLHINAQANKKSDSSGIEVSVSNKNGNQQALSELLGSALAQDLARVYKTKSQLRKPGQGVFVLDKNVCPSVLIEVGYLTNRRDYDFISSSSNQEKIASAILSGIEKFAASRDKSTSYISPVPTPHDLQTSKVDVLRFSVNNVTMNLQGVEFDTLPMVIVNGERISGSALNGNITVTADEVVVYQPHSAEAVATYGAIAEYGVMEFKNATFKVHSPEIAGDTLTKKRVLEKK